VGRLAQKPVNRNRRSTQPEEAKASRRRSAACRPAYLQGKLAVSHPQDAEERQADQVAQEVSRASLEPAITPEKKEESLAPRAARAGLHRQEQGEEEEVQTRLRRQEQEEEEEVQAKVWRQEEEEEVLPARLVRQPLEEEEEPVQPRLQRQEEEEVQARLFRSSAAEARVSAVPASIYRQVPEETVSEPTESEQEAAEQRQAEQEDPEEAGSTAGPGVMVAGQLLDEDTEARITALRGRGDPLDEAVREDLEAQFGADFGAVRLHTDGDAASLCGRVGARAFTVGDDIFFAPGEYAPDTDGGRNLLAHELTHVRQQGGGAWRVQRRVEPAPDPPHEAASASQRALDRLSRLEIPPIKQRHLPLYSTWAGSGQLKRIRGYARGRPAQISVWRREVQVDEAALEQKLQERGVALPPTPGGRVNFQVGPTKVSDTRANLLDRLKIPTWDRRGQATNFQVDHIVELQVSGENGTGVGNSPENMELLDQPSNSSSGGTIMNSIYGRVDEYLATLPSPPNRTTWLRTHDVIFDSVGVGGGRSDSGSAWWSRADVQQAEPVAAARPLPDRALEGEADTFVLASGPGGIEIGRFRHPASPLPQSFGPGNPAQAGRVAGLTIQGLSLNEASANAEAGVEIGSVTGTWDMPDRFRSESGQVTIPIVSVGPYAGYLGQLPAISAHFEPLSPVTLDRVDIRDTGLHAEGRIDPGLPLLAGTPIDVTLNGRDIAFRVEYSPENLSLPVPGVQIDDASLALGYSSADGFGASGNVQFSVDNLGSGTLTAGVSQNGGFQASGDFDFDSRLFDRARIQVWYRDQHFGGEGQIGIDQPDRIRGIRSADLTVGFGENAFNARGTVQPSIPGVQEAGLNVAYSEEQGLTIGGNLQLAEAPGIRSGSVDVTVNKRDGDWRVSARGEAQPSIPGIDSNLIVNYDDGAFIAEFSGAFQRGMLSGQVTAGVTNRAVGEDGQPSGEAAPGAPLIVYGGGSATVQIAPWLQGTAGVRFAPNGEVTVAGEIGLPSQVEIFPRKEIRKDIFSIDIPIPIVPGIFAEVGGGLDAHAGIGPGVIDQLRLGIEYNPAHEENTRVTGDGHVNVPADAGLRLSVHGGIGLGIPAASVTGGLEVGGELGLEGAAEAGVHVDWTPGTGLAIDAYGRLSAQPKFVFDVSGYVEVEALWFTIYENRWTLASFEYGSNLTFGVNFPIRYREGEPFDLSLDDVEFQVPDVSPRQILSDLVDRIT